MDKKIIMKRTLFLCILSIFYCSIAVAQSPNESAFRFGFKAGVNFSHMDFSKGSPPLPLETNWNTGITFGFVMLIPITGKLYFQPEYLYAQMGGSIKNSDTSYKLNYISMPLFLKYKFNDKFSLISGPQADILINAKRNIHGVGSNVTHDTEERSIAVSGGIEYSFIPSLSVCAKYMYGFNHIGLGQRSDTQEFKFAMFQLSACVQF